VLGLTATATARTCADVMSLLGIAPEGLVSVAPARPNLVLSASRDLDRHAGSADAD
jgi:superfamily II DNA helicase RecQ